MELRRFNPTKSRAVRWILDSSAIFEAEILCGCFPALIMSLWRVSPGVTEARIIVKVQI